MTREEAIKEINKVFEPAFANYIIIALTEGATPSDKALKQQSCEDCISRREVMYALCDTCELFHKNGEETCLTKCESYHFLATLPPVTPKEKTGWIPVSERLPEDEQEILFSTKTERVHSGKYHDDDSANQWYSHRDKCRAWNNVVTAWMPLPEPYKGGDTDEYSKLE